MTASQRTIVREALDQRARESLVGEVCLHCHAHLHGGHPNRVYCSEACKRAAWRQTPQGRAYSKVRKARIRARRQAAAA